MRAGAATGQGLIAITPRSRIGSVLLSRRALPLGAKDGSILGHSGRAVETRRAGRAHDRVGREARRPDTGRRSDRPRRRLRRR
jgi:hypothetical protein